MVTKIADTFRMVFIFVASSNDVILLRSSCSSCVVIVCFASSSIPHTQFLNEVFSRLNPANKQFQGLKNYWLTNVLNSKMLRYKIRYGSWKYFQNFEIHKKIAGNSV